MALSRQSLSPTANLLRNSRLFSLPNPLPRPAVGETFGSGVTRASDTATLPYPTHQAIVTTKSSLARGDWGLKRPLPSRSHLVQVSDPVLRITQLDTIEHVTDFDSAADHVRTRQKWEEMGVPMMKGLTQMRDSGGNQAQAFGAFEIRDDTTSYDTELGLDEAGLYLQALKKSMPSERAKAEWDTFNATWNEKWEAKKAAWRARGWTDEIADFEVYQEEAQRIRQQRSELREKAYKTEMDAFRASWDSKWAAKKAEWQTLGDVNHPDRIAGIAALNKEMAEARVIFEQVLAEKEAASSAETSPPNAPWLNEFLAFQKEQETARAELRQRLSAPKAEGSRNFTPFTPPPVDPIVHNTKRWKHDGPWLPGMGADDFVAYLSKEISGRKREFNAYLVEFVMNEIYTTRRLAASKAGETVPLDEGEAEKWRKEQEKAWRNITQAEINAGIKALRRETANDPLASKLVSKLILPFLKLPGIKFKPKAYAQDASYRDIDQYTFDQETAPLSTHPSAGLGYLRTKAYLANHPILGPQSSPTPVPARVVQARRTSTKHEDYARLGVGGFIANDEFRSADTTGPRANITNAKDVETIDVDTPGGKKILVQPLFGSVTNDGRIHIKLRRSTGPEVQVARGELDDKPPLREHFDADPLKDLAAGIGKTGVRELDEQSGQAQRLSEFLGQMSSPGRGKPPQGFPGVADALRGE